MEEYIDTRNVALNYERALAAFQADERISANNRALVGRFLRDAALGKTVIARAKKRIGPARLLGYIHQLYPLMLFVKKDLDAVVQDDLERFVEAIDAGRICSRSVVAGNAARPLSARYRVDTKFTVKKFYSWLWGNCRTYPEIVQWIETYHLPPEIPALSEGEVQRMLDSCTSTARRAVIQVLFDGGLRIGELLNVRLRHVQLREIGIGQSPLRFFVLRVPFSKTLRRTVPLPLPATTKWLGRWLEDHPARPAIRPDGTIESVNEERQLFTMSEDSIRQMLRRLGRRTLGKRVYPHLLRHSSATFWSNKMTYFQLCKRFGWSMTSRMPQRYIDRQGVEEMQVAEEFLQTEMSRLDRENDRLRVQLAASGRPGHRDAGPRMDPLWVGPSSRSIEEIDDPIAETTAPGPPPPTPPHRSVTSPERSARRRARNTGRPRQHEPR